MGEGYVDERNAQDFFDDHFIIQVDDRARANLVVHVAMEIPKISPIVIAADLADLADYREGREELKPGGYLSSGSPPTNMTPACFLVGAVHDRPHAGNDSRANRLLVRPHGHA